ncbi:MAG: hypothetical protein AAF653_07800 [Chloroflexota bacterium]
MTEHQMPFDSLILHLTYHRATEHLQVLVVCRTPSAAHMVCCQQDRGIVRSDHFADVMAAKHYLLERHGIPLEAWLDTDYPYADMLETPDVEVATTRVARLVADSLLMSGGAGNTHKLLHEMQIGDLITRHRITHHAIVRETHTLHLRVRRQLPRAYRYWLIQPVAERFLQEGDIYSAIFIYSDFLELDFRAARRCVQRLHGESNP